MEVEDDYLEDLEDMERLVAETNAALAKTNAALAEKSAALAKKDAALTEKNAALTEKDAVIEKAISLLVAGGLSEKDARAKLLG
jgi:hypothetical protein